MMAALPVVSAPRFQSVPAGSVGSRGAEAVEVARGAGLELSEEQRMVLHAGLGVRVDGSWSAFEVALIEPRQRGDQQGWVHARVGGHDAAVHHVQAGLPERALVGVDDAAAPQCPRAT